MKTFDNFSDWLQYTKIAALHFYKGVSRLALSVVNGTASLLVALWGRLVRCVGGYPNIALCAFLVIVLLTWVMTFVSMRARAVGAEDKLGAVSYEYHVFKEMHGYGE